MAFATADDIQTRLMRDLSAAETQAAELLLEGVQAQIETVAGKTEASMDPLPTILRVIAIGAVCRELSNPTGVLSLQESLGAYSYSSRYRDNSGGLLTAREELLIRQAFGKASGSMRVPALPHDAYVQPENSS